MTERSIDIRWEELLDQLQQLIGKRPSDLNAVLFLIGVQELGTGPKRFSKEAKQDLMHIAVCKVLSPSGYYTYAGRDKDGWPQWTSMRSIPHGDLSQQEDFLKTHVIQYFELLLV